MAQGPYIVYGWARPYVMYIFKLVTFCISKMALLCMEEKELRHSSVCKSTFLLFSNYDVFAKIYVIINEYAHVINRIEVSRLWWASRRLVMCLDPYRPGYGA